MLYIELFILFVAIFWGARIGGVGLGVMGGIGLAVLVFIFGLKPSEPPVEVMLIIVAVISASAVLQAAKGLDFLVRVAEKILKKNPKHITLIAPLVTYFFTFFAGTGHIVYSILPIIYKLSLKTGIRPERPLSISVIASQQAITASPVSAATATMLALFSGKGVELSTILVICMISTIIGVISGALVSYKKGKELNDDPFYLERLKNPEFAALLAEDCPEDFQRNADSKNAKLSVLIFGISVFIIIILGAIKELRPVWTGSDGKPEIMSMVIVIQIIMLSAAALMIIISKVKVTDVSQGSVFKSGMEAVISIFGIAWMGDTFIKNNFPVINESINGIIKTAPWTFAVALFLMSILLYSQAVTVRTLMPLGISLGISPVILVAMFPSVNGYFFIPNYPTIVAAMGFDKTGTTKVGKFLFNHSFMLPGIVSTATAVITGLIISGIFFR